MKEEVPWDVFVEEFCNFFGIKADLSEMEKFSQDPTIQGLKCLKALLASPPSNTLDIQEVVTLEKFGKILQWFGPIGDPETTPKDATLIHNMRNILQNRWFHGDVEEKFALQQLLGKPGGTFLIRFSSIDGYFTISLMTNKGTIRHQRIKHKPGSDYVLDGESFSSLQDLVVSKNLTLPCTGSKFLHIFHDSPTDGHSNGYVWGSGSE
eukprot:TRINITY_DN1720_c0_g1_i3.p1 TRINITY_DN1720_c0_g1~~TRINITY_DN1720_c0_g1_i3.p1  ORF type:complete len:208 (+),score=35.18 TRINITY_DN1720_c0_g1_i3:265-888(+)